MKDKERVMIANITWNDSDWKKIYINPKAGHKYAKNTPGHESLNFDFDKKGLDSSDRVYGFVEWTVGNPRRLSENALVIFLSKNLKTNQREIVGIYGDVRILEKPLKTKWSDFENNELLSNISAKKELSILFPNRLLYRNYTKKGFSTSKFRYFTYTSEELATEIIMDEIKELNKSGKKLSESKKLKIIYKFLTGNSYSKQIEDEKEQEELLELIKTQSKQEIIKNLKALTPQASILVNINGKQYKRDNKTIIG